MKNTNTAAASARASRLYVNGLGFILKAIAEGVEKRARGSRGVAINGGPRIAPAVLTEMVRIRRIARLFFDAAKLETTEERLSAADQLLVEHRAEFGEFVLPVRPA